MFCACAQLFDNKYPIVQWYRMQSEALSIYNVYGLDCQKKLHFSVFKIQNRFRGLLCITQEELFYLSKWSIFEGIKRSCPIL